MKYVYLFDIDGTILSLKKNFLRSLIEELLFSLHLDPGIVKRINYSGRTDTAIFRDLLGEQRNNNHLFQTLKYKYLKSLDRHLTKDHLTVFDGAADSILYLRNRGMGVGLCTGNFKEAAYIKLKTAGLEQHFPFGAFGCVHTNRNFLPAEAAKKFHVYSGKSISQKNYVIIGDTPNDIACARHFGAKSVVVTTGNFEYRDLQKYKPDLLLDSLKKPELWVQQVWN